MKPVLFSIGTFNVYAFGLFLALAFIVSTFIVWKLSREEFREEEYLDAYFYTALVSLFSARLIYIIRNFSEFQFLFLKYILVVNTPGLSLLGGAIGGGIFLYFYARKNRFNFYHLMDIFSISSSLSLGLIKIGELLSGGAYGRQTDFFIRVRIEGRPGFYHPAELYEAILYFLMFAVLSVLYKKGVRQRWQEGTITYIYITGFSVTTFLLEFIKVFRVYLYGLSFRQLLAIIILAAINILFLFRTGRINRLLVYFKKQK